MDEAIQSTLARITTALAEQKIQHALVGGLAASVRGRTRVTEDIDLVIDCDIETAISLIERLGESNFHPFFPDVAKVVRECCILPLEDAQTGVKIDLAIGISGFEKMLVNRATAMQFAEISINVVTVEDLVIMKALAGRAQDEQDIRGILVSRGPSMDWTYCLKIAAELQAALSVDLVAKISTLKKKHLSSENSAEED